MQLVKQVSLTKDIAVRVKVDSKERIVREVGFLTYHSGFLSLFICCLFKKKIIIIIIITTNHVLYSLHKQSSLNLNVVKLAPVIYFRQKFVGTVVFVEFI